MSDPQRREIFLTEMGIGPTWRSRKRTTSGKHAPEHGTTAEAAGEDLFAQQQQAGPVELDMPELPPAAPAAPKVAPMSWDELRQSVVNCVKCDLCHGRTRTVFGVGDEKARWLFVGEGPGRNEDQQGEPFVGPAGKLLDNMLAAMGVRRGDNAYIANIVKCRPTDSNGKDRPPSLEEIAACLPYLERQIALIDPAVIVAVGKTAAVTLLGLDPDTPVSKLRGVVHQYAGRPLVVTYHPAYLLRNMADKKKAWEDLCLAMATYASIG